MRVIQAKLWMRHDKIMAALNPNAVDRLQKLPVIIGKFDAKLFLDRLHLFFRSRFPRLFDALWQGKFRIGHCRASN